MTYLWILKQPRSGNLDDAMESLETALHYSSNDSQQLTVTYSNLSVVLSEKGRYALYWSQPLYVAMSRRYCMTRIYIWHKVSFLFSITSLYRHSEAAKHAKLAMEHCERRLEGLLDDKEFSKVEQLKKQTSALAIACYNYAVQLEHVKGEYCIQVKQDSFSLIISSFA